MDFPTIEPAELYLNLQNIEPTKVWGDTRWIEYSPSYGGTQDRGKVAAQATGSKSFRLREDEVATYIGLSTKNFKTLKEFIRKAADHRLASFDGSGIRTWQINRQEGRRALTPILRVLEQNFNIPSPTGGNNSILFLILYETYRNVLQTAMGARLKNKISSSAVSMATTAAGLPGPALPSGPSRERSDSEQLQQSDVESEPNSNDELSNAPRKKPSYRTSHATGATYAEPRQRATRPPNESLTLDSQAPHAPELGSDCAAGRVPPALVTLFQASQITQRSYEQADAMISIIFGDTANFDYLSLQDLIPEGKDVLLRNLDYNMLVERLSSETNFVSGANQLYGIVRTPGKPLYATPPPINSDSKLRGHALTCWTNQEFPITIFVCGGSSLKRKSVGDGVSSKKTRTDCT